MRTLPRRRGHQTGHEARSARQEPQAPRAGGEGEGGRPGEREHDWREATPLTVGRLAKPVIRLGIEAARLGQRTARAVRAAAAEAQAEVQKSLPDEVASSAAAPESRHVAMHSTTFDLYRRHPARDRFIFGLLTDLLTAALIPVLICAAAAYGVASQQDEVYAARGEVILDLRRVDWGAADRFIEAQVVIGSGHTLLRSTADQYDLALSQLEDDLEVYEVDGSGVLRFQYANRDPQVALDVLRGLLDRYLVQLRQFEQREGGSHRLLTAPFVLEEPVRPRPLRAAALGAVAGLALGGLAVFLRLRVWQVR